MKNISDAIENQYEGKLIFSYKGKPSSEMVTSIIHLVEGKLDFLEPEKITRKKVFRIVVEVLQNIIHQVENLDELKFPSFIFYLVRELDHYILISCNRLIDEKANLVMDRIRSFIALSESDQKKIYLDILGNGKFSARGGAGLGLLDMIRSSNGNFFYDILPSGYPGHKLFYLKIKVFK
jgi:superfamily I DNA and RNA helicase